MSKPSFGEVILIALLCCISVFWGFNPDSKYAEPISQLIDALLRVIPVLASYGIFLKMKSIKTDKNLSSPEKESNPENSNSKHLLPIIITIILTGVVCFSIFYILPHRSKAKVNVVENIEHKDDEFYNSLGVDKAKKGIIDEFQTASHSYSGNQSKRYSKPSILAEIGFYYLLFITIILVLFLLYIISEGDMFSCLEIPVFLIIATLFVWFIKWLLKLGFVPAELYYERVVGTIKAILRSAGLI